MDKKYVDVVLCEVRGGDYRKLYYAPFASGISKGDVVWVTGNTMNVIAVGTISADFIDSTPEPEQPSGENGQTNNEDITTPGETNGEDEQTSEPEQSDYDLILKSMLPIDGVIKILQYETA